MKTRKVWRCAQGLLAALLICPLTATPAPMDEERFVFETWSGQKIDAYRGALSVPENRDAPDSRAIPLAYVRLPATGETAGSPIVYLAGGPGGSGIQAINYRYDMFVTMRKYGDVIALDQRGTGESNVVPECRSTQAVPTASETTDDRFVEYRRAALAECLAFWRREGVDLGGYDTVQNARDLDALREHLGARQIVLWGTSYGSHLALAALGQMEDGIARVVLSSVEGLDQTIKLPARTDEYLSRLQRAIDAQPDAKAAYPDVAALMRRVHARLERKPVLVELAPKDGASISYLLQRRDMQRLAAGLIADPKSAAALLEAYRALDRSAAPAFDRIPARLLTDDLAAPGEPITFDGMAVATDLASGLTQARRAPVMRQAETAVLGAFLDDTLHLHGIAPELDLGDGFRTPARSDVPVLVFAGTLDGRTDIASQREAVSALRNVTFITVEHAGHNLFDAPSADMLAAIDAFMTGRPVADRTIAVPVPELAPAAP